LDENFSRPITTFDEVPRLAVRARARAIVHRTRLPLARRGC